jgi:hypothetical protein
MAKFIGVSVSKSIRAMVEGEVDPKEVKKIIAGTACASAQDWEEVIRAYRERRWDESDPDACEKLLRQFLSDERVEQPRLLSGMAPDLGAMYRYWGRGYAPFWFVTKEKNIKYWDPLRG